MTLENIGNEDGQKQCPRCASFFKCNRDNIGSCQCNITLSSQTLEFLKATYFDCLCRDCLKHFDSLIHDTEKLEFPVSPELLQEGVHYYIEGGKWVFTEIYHLLRGNCCESGCRHCVYGFQHKKK